MLYFRRYLTDVVLDAAEPTTGQAEPVDHPVSG
jgi:hypothetical protein